MSTDRATSFGSAAAAYERGRPGYPTEAVDFVLPPGVRRVLDLGAGTGKLARQLVARALDVVAVEPLEQMRAELHRVLSEVRVLAGTAEALPLPDGSVDAVLVAQAWHWVHPVRALPEVARVLAPGGHLGLLWNRPLEPEGSWTAELARVVARRARGGQPAQRTPTSTPFGPDDITSRSHVITLPDDERARPVTEVRKLLATHPATTGRDNLSMPWETHCVRAELLTPAR